MPKSKSQKFKIPVVVHSEEGSGEINTTIFNDIEALWAHLNEDRDEPLTDEEKEERLNNPCHEDGYIEHDEIEIEIVDGKARLNGHFRFHGGQ